MTFRKRACQQRVIDDERLIQTPNENFLEKEDGEQKQLVGYIIQGHIQWNAGRIARDLHGFCFLVEKSWFQACIHDESNTFQKPVD